MTEQWRDCSTRQRDEFIQWVEQRAAQRMVIGAHNYGDRFQGDPLAHLIEEMLDGAFYAWQAMRERQELLAEIDNLGGDITAAGMAQSDKARAKRLPRAAAIVRQETGINVCPEGPDYYCTGECRGGECRGPAASITKPCLMHGNYCQRGCPTGVCQEEADEEGMSTGPAPVHCPNYNAPCMMGCDRSQCVAQKLTPGHPLHQWQQTKKRIMREKEETNGHP